jgi:molybdenum cofactor cytidylyltransferase
MRGAEVVVNDSYGQGCSSSIAASLPLIDPAADTLVLMLGDQPGVTAATVCGLVQGRGDAPVAVCRYDDGRGHPFAFGREAFGDLADLHGDKAVWKLLEQRPELVHEVRMPGRIPPDVDTWDDYDTVLAAQ